MLHIKGGVNLTLTKRKKGKKKKRNRTTFCVIIFPNIGYCRLIQLELLPRLNEQNCSTDCSKVLWATLLRAFRCVGEVANKI